MDKSSTIIPIDWNNLEDIPNEAGTLITILNKNSQLIKTKVRRSNKTGFHTLIGCKIKDAIGWQPRKLKKH